MTTQNHAPTAGKPLFLYIPVSRLILLSIFSCGAYQAYWIYKNWWFISKRENSQIRPFWRGVFGILFCHSLLWRIHDDDEARGIQVPGFSPAHLATIWLGLVVVANTVGRAPGSVGIIAAFLPSFLCFVPVQNHINRLSRKRNANEAYYGWSAGHILCVIIGILIWARLFVSPGEVYRFLSD
jgi:hypothetical protein